MLKNNIAHAFESNSSESLCHCGGGIHVHKSFLNFTGNITFKSNSVTGKHSHGGGIFAIESIIILTENVTFSLNNSTQGNGGAAMLWYSTLTITGGSSFSDNTAGSGGGIFALSSTLKVAGKSMENVTRKFSRSCNTFTSVFMDNSAQLHGGGLYTENSTLLFEGCIIFSGNSALYYGGGICSRNSTVMFSGNTLFSSNSGCDKQSLGGGIYGLGTSLYFSGNSNFTANPFRTSSLQTIFSSQLMSFPFQSRCPVLLSGC